MKDIEKTILACNSYIKSKTEHRFAFCGSCGLYLQGISLGRELHDIDIKFPDLDFNEALSLGLEFNPKLDVLDEYKPENAKYIEVELNGEKLVVETVESIISYKRDMLDYLAHKAKIMDESRIRQREKQTRDLEYLKKEYGL